MADVQLEHGFVRIANALDEAITYADFSGTQSKQVRCLMRLTFGWQQKNVRISVGDLAERCGLAHTGGFRRELDKLIAEGVVLEVERGHGRTPATYSITKNFEQWGRYSVASATLERLFGARPTSLYRVPPQGQATEDRPPQEGQPTPPPTAPSEADEASNPGDEPDDLSAPIGDLSAPIELDDCPNGGTHAGDNSPDDAQLQARKESERKERQLLIQRAEKFAVRLVGAANNANAEKFGEWTRVRPFRWDTATQMCVEFLQAGIDPDVACQAVADAIRFTKHEKPVNSITYYANTISDAHAADQQRQLDRLNPAPSRRTAEPTQPRVTVSPKGEVSSFDRAEDERQRRTQYDAERRTAGTEWGKDPANESKFRAIVAEATEHYKLMLHTPWGERQRDVMVLVQCATAAGFPSFEDWCRRQLGGTGA